MPSHAWQGAQSGLFDNPYLPCVNGLLLKWQNATPSISCRLFKDELRVMDAFRSFQRYFFMDAGDWAEHLTETLCDASAQHGILHEHSVQSMLESSFKGSSAEHDATAANLKISLQIPLSQSLSHEASPTPSEASLQHDGASPGQPPSRGHGKSVQVDNRSLRALDTVQLSYDLEWPLALVITQVPQCRAGCCCVCISAQHGHDWACSPRKSADMQHRMYVSLHVLFQYDLA